MTANTETERAEFEKIMRREPSFKPELMVWDGGRYELDAMEFAWQGFLLGMQAARRAPVVPQGWKLAPDEVPDEMVDAAIEAYMPFGDMRFAIIAALAAAPQPPEAAQLDDINVVDMAQAVDSKEAAPVQLPEPVAYLHECGKKPSLRALEFSKGAIQLSAKGYKSKALYTEHQVRQLLAAHGIK